MNDAFISIEFVSPATLALNGYGSCILSGKQVYQIKAGIERRSPSDKTVTAWIPFQTTPLEMGPLEFSSGSHVIEAGRELEIGDESESQIQQHLRVTNFKQVIEPFDAGEISFHSGWVFHRAGANITNQIRIVMTIIYMDKDMKLKNPENKNQVNDWHTWCPGAKVGEIINSPINPILFQK